ncbi:hypothetical protein L7F22_051401 [Adiantum nelumboides]|nr:hypothetical protein [Adiantum nelumboides]
MVQGLERFFKSAIVDRNSSISSAALVSAYQLQVAARDVVRRWGMRRRRPSMQSRRLEEAAWAALVGQAATLDGVASRQPRSAECIRRHSQQQLHHPVSRSWSALPDPPGRSNGRHQACPADGQYQQGHLRSPFAVCMLVRYAAKVAEEDPNLRSTMMDMLEGWLRHKSDMVNHEAARVLCDLRGITSSELTRPIAVLQLFLSSSKSTLKFAAIRTLAKLAQTHPAAVQTCNVDMENLITDTNRSVATYAITTLLKTGNEASVDRLMKQISGFMAEISDEFKVIVVDAIRSLCLKFPSKQTTMLSFLSGVLRDEGGYDFKRAVVEAIFDMIQFIGDCKETALAHLCEFIEDCEFTKLSVRILHLLGVEGPKMNQPHKYIRYIYNRVILENAIVRAAAVNSLVKFGLGDASLTARITVLLERCLDDVDDEDSMYKLAALESSLQSYVEDPSSSVKNFDASTVPRVTREEQRQEELKAKNEAVSKVAMASETQKAGPSTGAGTIGGGAVAGNGTAAGADKSEIYASELAKIDEMKGYGSLLKSSKTPVELTERETEYVVSAVTHIFAEHIVLQYNITNTLPDTILDNVAVVVGGASEIGLSEDYIIQIPSLTQAEPSGTVYVSFTRDEGSNAFPQGTLTNTLRFLSREVDPSTGEAEEEGYDDQYETSELELGTSDYVQERWADWSKEWEALGKEHSATETFALTALESLKGEC